MFTRLANWYRQRRARLEQERQERERTRCPRCGNTMLREIACSSWGYIEYQCANGHLFDVDVGDNFGM